MKPYALLALFVFAACVAAPGSCSQKFEEAQGVHVVKDVNNPGHYVVVEDAGGGKVGQILTTAQGATSGIPIAGQVVAGLTMLAQLAHQLALMSANRRKDALNAEADKAIANHNTTHEATSEGLQAFVDAHPKAIGDALIAHLDAAHDDADVPGHHQDVIQPSAKATA